TVDPPVEALDWILDLQGFQTGALELVIGALGIDGQGREGVTVRGDGVVGLGLGGYAGQQCTSGQHSGAESNHSAFPPMKVTICVTMSRCCRLPPWPPRGYRNARSPKVVARK